MTFQELDRVLRAFNRRRPFRPYLIEFVSGNRVLIGHPEAVSRTGTFYTYLDPKHRVRVFTASGVCQLLDPHYDPLSNDSLSLDGPH
jgi:hypothetical protein